MAEEETVNAERADQTVVIDEVMRHWLDWMREKGADVESGNVSSPNFDPDDSEREHGSYSDYGEHATLMDASPAEYSMFLAMLAARGITIGGSA